MKSRNIILLSAQISAAQNIAQHLSSEFGLTTTSLDDLSNTDSGQHIVCVVNQMADLDSLKESGYVVDLNKYNTNSVVAASEQIFDEACDYFLGSLSTEELTACA